MRVLLLGTVFASPSLNCAPAAAAPETASPMKSVHPIVLAERLIARPAKPPPGTRYSERERDMPFVLFLPEGWQKAFPPANLAIHFHTPDWLAIGEHMRAGQRCPLVSIYLGEGSTKYRTPFLDPTRFTNLIAIVEARLAALGGAGGRIQTVDVSSFSAGYGAVRELVQQPAAFSLIRRIVLSDSLYGSLASGADGKGPRVVAAEHVDCWLPFVRAAVRGEKTFVLTHSEEPTPAYASSSECAAAILAAVGLQHRQVTPESEPAAKDPTYPLRLRADSGNLHIWGYAGRGAKAHTAHPRRLAEVWLALENQRD